jgi:cation/acetate symporter
LIGLIACRVVLSPAVWVAVLGHSSALFPYDNPTLFSMPLAFVRIKLFSKLDPSERAKRVPSRLRCSIARPELESARLARCRFD